MRPYSIAQLRILAERYCAATSQTPHSVSDQIFGVRNRKLINRLLNGGGCTADNLERASEWFSAQWPENIPWPISAQRNGIC